MDKYESRRLALKRLIDLMGRGAIATVAAEIGKSPSYVSRMLYEPGKAGAKRIGEDMLELLAQTYPDAFSEEMRMFGRAPERPTNQPDSSPEVTEIRLLLALTAQALAASTPIAGRELATAIRKHVDPSPDTFAGKLVKELESELSDLADTFRRTRTSRGSR